MEERQEITQTQEPAGTAEARLAELTEQVRSLQEENARLAVKAWQEGLAQRGLWLKRFDADKLPELKASVELRRRLGTLSESEAQAWALVERYAEEIARLTAERLPRERAQVGTPTGEGERVMDRVLRFHEARRQADAKATLAESMALYFKEHPEDAARYRDELVNNTYAM